MNKVLFVSRANPQGEISFIPKAQGESLRANHLEVSYYPITGKGIWAYIKHCFLLRRHLKFNHYQVIHAHYSLSAITTVLAGARPVVSLMGTDVQAKFLFRWLIKYLSKHYWKATIVKSTRMKNMIGIDHAYVIPNGVDFSLFKPIPKKESLQKVGFEEGLIHILFMANPKRVEKNVALAEKAIALLENPTIKLNFVYNVEQEIVPYYINAVDLVLLTSLWEGSPNIIKEAMACGTPIVTTLVGDVDDIIGDTKGCYVTSYEPRDVADAIRKAIEFGQKTQGREKIQHLDRNHIAWKLIEIYQITSNVSGKESQ